MITREEYLAAKKVVQAYEKQENERRAAEKYGAGYANIQLSDHKVLPSFVFGNRPCKVVYFSTELDGVENRKTYDASIEEVEIRGKIVYSVSGTRTFKNSEEEAIKTIYGMVKNNIKSMLKNGI